MAGRHLVATRQNPFAPGARYVPPQDTFQIATTRPDVRFLSQAVQPPSQVYVEQTDVLRIAAASSQANEALTVSWRLLLPSGDIVLNQASLAVPATRVLTIHDEPMAEGFLLSVSCRAAVATTRGQTFARIFLTDPDLGAGQPSYMLMADYVTTAMAPSHPNGRVLAPSEGPGARVIVAVTTPPAGSGWSQLVPTNARWKMKTFFGILTTSAVAVSHVATIVVTSLGGISFFEGISPNTQTAGVVSTYGGAGFTPPLGSLLKLGMIALPLDEPLLPTDNIQGLVANMDAGDQWSFVALGVEEWLDNV